MIVLARVPALPQKPTVVMATMLAKGRVDAAIALVRMTVREKESVRFRWVRRLGKRPARHLNKQRKKRASKWVPRLNKLEL